MALYNLDLVGFILSTTGEILVAYTVIQVHSRVWKEHKMNEQVFAEMRRERRVAMWGIVFMVVGFVMQLPARL